MPTSQHEELVMLFREHPELAPKLLRDVFDVPLPPGAEVRIESGEIPQIVPPAKLVDAVVVCLEAGKPKLAIAVEAQLRPDKDKESVWPLCVTTLRARLGCPACVIVVTPDHATAEWCKRPIDLGPPAGNTWCPLVLGPDLVPIVDDPERAEREPELAVLSVWAHGESEETRPCGRKGSGPRGSHLGRRARELLLGRHARVAAGGRPASHFGGSDVSARVSVQE